MTCPGDYNFDGIVDGSDLGDVLSSWGPCSLRNLCGESESLAMSSFGQDQEQTASAVLATFMAGLGFESMQSFVTWANQATAEQRASVVAAIEVAMEGL